MKAQTEAKLKQYYERKVAQKKRADERLREQMWRRPTCVRGASQRAARFNVTDVARMELPDVEPHKLPMRTLDEREIAQAHESWEIGSFMSWSLFDRMDEAQRQGVIMRLREKNGR